MKKINYLLLCALLSNYHATANSYSTNAAQDTQNIPNIFQDVREGNKEAIRKRLEDCENCAIKDEQGNNALHIAVEKGNTEIVEILATALDYPTWSHWFYAFIYAPTLPNINDINSNGDTPLHCSINANKPDSTTVLLKNNANMEIVNKKNLSALFAAVKRDAAHFIPIFVAHKLNLSNHRHNGDTIFHYAIQKNKTKTIRHCIQETSLINVSNNNHKTPTFLVIDKEDIELLKLLYKGLNIPASNGIKPIHYATKNSKYNAIDYLLANNITINEPDTEGNPALFYAVNGNNKEMMHYLLSCGADIQQRNNLGEDIFAIASRNENPHLAQYLAQMPGVDINARDNKGQTSFMRSSLAQDYEGMKRLINMGVNIRITDSMNENVLHKIARIGSNEGAKIILNHDSSLLIDRNKDGLTPLSVAAQQKEHNDLLALLVAHKADVNTEDNNGLTPLHHAAAHDNVQAMMMLQKHGALCAQRTNKSNTIAHSAAEKGSVNALNYCIRLNPNFLFARNNNNETPFIIAAKNGSTEAVIALLNENDFITNDIQRAMNLAYSNGHYNTFKFLQQKNLELIEECQKIVTIRMETTNLINENNNARSLLYYKNPLYIQTYIAHTSTNLDNYSRNELCTMTEMERNNIKNLYLEGQNKELNFNKILRQELSNIAKAEERAAVQEANRQELIRQQQAELNRITERNRMQQIAQENVYVMPSQNCPIQEEAANPIVQKECCICFEEATILIPCKNKHSDVICSGCLARLTNCPLCRAELTK